MENTGSESSSTPQKSGGSKKFLLISLIVLLLLGALGYLTLSKNGANVLSIFQKSKNSNSSPAEVGSIQDALAKSDTLKCDFTGDNGNRITAYIKGGKVRTDLIGSDTSYVERVIIKDNKMYFWSGNKGFIMTFNPSNMMDTKTTQGSNLSTIQQNPGSVINNLEKYKRYCVKSPVEDSQFAEPGDVEFTDMSEWIKQGGISLPSPTITEKGEKSVTPSVTKGATPQASVSAKPTSKNQ